jgi:LmbE family N-acetylglucosaminyl deacetylase
MLTRFSRPIVAATLLIGVLVAPARVRTQVTPLKFDQGATGLGLALRQLPVEGTVLYVTAHPDDENNGVLVALNRGRGLKTSLLTVTRGDGGQNEIGPELFQAIGILRGEELAGVHKYDGADQFHTRAYEFGYSFSVEETFEKWGKDEILKDVVRVIRSVRPDVILTMNRDGMGGGQHHQASARLAHEAFRVAADPARYPEQIKEGLRPWQARKIYQAGGGPGGGRGGAAAGSENAAGGPVRVSTGDYDPLLGMSSAQFGQIARGYHQCQGTGQLEAFPGESGGAYMLYDSEPKITGAENDILAGVDTSVKRLVAFAAGEDAKVPTFAADLAAIESAARSALDSFDARAQHKTLPHLAQGLARVRQLRAAIAASTISAGPKAEIVWRLDRKAQDFMKALQLAQGIVVHVTANDGNVVRGQTFTVTAQVFNTGPEPMSVESVPLNMPAGWTATLQNGQASKLASNQASIWTYAVTVGPNARYSQPFWKVHPGVDRYDLEVPEHQTLPWSPPDVTATINYTAAGASATISSPAYYRYDGPWVGGQKEKVVNIVPSLSVKLTPEIAVVPLAAVGKPREFRVTVANNAKTGAAVQVRLEAPAGWSVQPAVATINFGVEEEEVTSQFFVTPPAKLQAGTSEIKAVAVRDGQPYREGYQVIAYNHIQERHLFHPATSTVKIFEVSLPANLQIGYVMGTGDEVPQAIRQLGATLTMLDADDVAFGDLSRFSTIVLGIRAYEKRADVRAYNQRLLDFARNGGHLVVQYNKVAMNQLGAGAAGGGGRGFGGDVPAAGAPGGGRGAGGPGGPPPGAPAGAPPGGAAAPVGGPGGRGGRGGGAPPASPYVPYPGGITSNRVSVEEAPLRVLEEGVVELGAPNKITAVDFQGWVQERGLYFFGANDPHYTDLLASTDSWPYNPGEKRGLLTTAQLGKGTWTYVGLGLWRQLPAGTQGAYRIMANLIAKPRAK